MKIRIIILILIAGGLVGAAYYIKPWKQAVESPPRDLADFIGQTFSENREVPPDDAPEEQVKGTTTPAVAPVNKEISFSCTGAQGSEFDCFKEYFAGLVQGQGIKAAFADLRARYDENSYVRSQCHPITHVLGFEASKLFKSVGEAYTEGDSFCWSGYYHGVMEGIINRIGYANLKAEMDTICSAQAEKGRYSFDHYNCVHGLGHGVMALTGNELPQSLEMCDAVIDAWERQSCWSGAFMENIIVDNKNHFTKYLKPADPLYPCNGIDDKYRYTCYLMQTSYMLKTTNGDFSKVFGLCQSVEDAYRTTCYMSLGRDVSGRSTSNVQATLSGCNLGTDEEQREYCFIGAVKDFISYFHSDVQGKELCAAITEEKISKSCSDTAESYYKLF